ncbi:MAG: bifunctional proline dehydrogenase/L-glutamate gamma-semialdehyde dehydrogenase PutA, partial [Woeseia sp.]
MKFTEQPTVSTDPLGDISRHYLADETALVESLARKADAGDAARLHVQQTATELVNAVRDNAVNEGGIDAFLQQYDLSSQEGVLLMCIAEALLRIPDTDTADRLIADKVTSARWKDHLGASDSLFVNASTWGLMLTGEILRVDESAKKNPAHYIGRIASRAGEPVVRAAMRQAMRIMGHQFVMGRDIHEALARSKKKESLQYRHSYDMLGEAALTAKDASRYFESYSQAIRAIGDSAAADDMFDAPGISVKLSALHPRYLYTQHKRIIADLVPILTDLALQAEKAGIGLTVDAEEADRLEISLELFAAVRADTRLKDYEGLGLAVQAYQRRASDVLAFVIDLAATHGRRIPVRLVKGAYWDTEIKRAQELGLASYPVFTRKAHTDVSYLACAQQMLEAGERLYPQFATHNAHTLASVLHYAGSRTDFEFQRLHGMGEELYAEVINPQKYNRPCRVYAPVGSHEDLLPYLVRRLLENGANTSFVNRIVDESIAVEDIVRDPIEISREGGFKPHPRIPQADGLFGCERRNSAGHNLADRKASGQLLQAMQKIAVTERVAAPIVGGKRLDGEPVESRNPANTSQVIGICRQADGDAVDQALELA